MSGAHWSASVALVGPEYERSENLALRVLAAALLEKGHRPRLVPLTTPHDFEPAAQLIAARAPDAVGISIAYEGSAWLLAAFPLRLRQLGFAGPIVAGGVFATLHAHELLRSVPGLDGVVRHDGEVAITKLAEATLGRARLQQVPGLVHRTESALLDSTPCDFSRFDVWPWRGPHGLPRHLDLPVADMVAGRGCARSCPYCCVAALRASARDHAKDFDVALVATSTRRRSVDDIADEMAALSTMYRARVFHFQDDSFLPDQADEAAMYLEELVGALKHRKVHERAVVLKVRADQLSREVSALLAQLGVVGAFVGIEALTPALAKRLGRQPQAPSTRAALGRLRRLGIATYFNSLAVGPEASLEEVQAELEALSAVRGVPFEIVRVAAYGGTALEHRLRQQGRLRGCGFVHRYDFVDARVERLSTAMQRIATRHFGKRSPAKRVADLTYNVALARRFFPSAFLTLIERQTGALVKQSNAVQVEAAQAIAVLVKRGHDASSDAVTRVVLDALKADAQTVEALLRLAGELEAEVAREGAQSPRAFFRGAPAAPNRASVPMAQDQCLGPAPSPSSCTPHLAGRVLGDLLEDVDDEAVTEVALLPFAGLEGEAVDGGMPELLDDSDLLDDKEPGAPVAGGAPTRGSTSMQVGPAQARPSTEHGCDLTPGRRDLQRRCGSFGYCRATVQVDAQARVTLVQLEEAGVAIAPDEPVFACVAQLLASYDLSCFSGETLVLEDAGPMD